MKDKIVYMLLTIGLVWGAIACEDKDFEGIVSNTDDYVSETGGDYYEGGGIDVSHYDRARAFPGLVDTLKEKRLDEAIVNIDLSRNSVASDKVNLKVVAPAIYSTGLYAGAGEKITLTLDDDVKGLIVQIGVHTRDLSSLVGTAYLERDAKITSAMPLFQGTNGIRNPYGGYIWIKRTGANNSDAPTISVKVKGAYAAPDYIQGETDADEWIQKINETTVPWIELRGEQMAFSVPVKYMKQKLQQGKTFVTQMDEALRLWNDWMLCYNEFYGLDGEDIENYPDFPVLGFPFREVMDVHLLTERFSYYSTTNVELLSSEEVIDAITDPELIKQNAINICHIMGWIQTDMYIPTYFPSTTLSDFKNMYLLMPNYYFLYKNGWWGETNTSNLFSGKKQGTNVMASTSYQLLSSAFTNLAAFANADSCKIFNKNVGGSVESDYGSAQTWPAVLSFFSAILSYEQVDADKDGWKYFGYLNRFLKKQSELLPASRRLNMQDAMLTCLTTYFERDFSQLFDRWGIMVGDAQRVEAAKYKHVEKRIWDYNPLKKNETAVFDGKAFQTLSGKYPYLHLRSDWAVVAYSGKEDNLKAKNYSYNFFENKHLTNLEDNPDKYNEAYCSPYNLFDNDPSTLWSSYHDPYTDVKWFDGEQKYAFKVDKLYYGAKTPDYPYSLVVQPGNVGIDIDGVYVAFGDYNSEASIYNGDVKDYQKYDFHPQHIMVEVTNDQLSYDDIDTLYTNIKDIQWRRVYDSKDDPKGGKVNGQQFWPDRRNTFYVEFARQSGVTGIRLIMDTDSHVAKDRPANFPVDEKPNRPEFANKYLNRIQKIAEFGTFYFKED